MEKAAEGKLLSLLRAEPDVHNQRDALISLLHEKWVLLRRVAGGSEGENM